MILTNLDTTLLATMSKVHPHEGKQNNANVQLSKKRYTAKDNLDGRGGSNRRFDEASTHAGKSLIKSYTNLYIAHHDKNKGKCKRGFMQGLVEAVTKVAAVSEINRDDIHNKVRRVQKEHKAAANACVTISLESSESLAVVDNNDDDDHDNNSKKRPVLLAPVPWSPTATTLDNGSPDTVMATCLDGGITIHTGGAGGSHSKGLPYLCSWPELCTECQQDYCICKQSYQGNKG